MPAYQQMGHQSDNLLAEPALGGYAGALLSPVNYSAEQVAAQVAGVQAREGFEAVMDPQLYVPDSERGQLRTWPYFPADVDSADLTSETWWASVAHQLAGVCRALGVPAVCSPAVVPRAFSVEYFTSSVRAAELLADHLQGSGIQLLQTAVVGLADLSQAGRALEIASIVSRTPADRIYLVLVGDTEPRRELTQVEELKGAMRLIAALESADLRVLVGHCSSDLLLWKAAGATACASGKFFNLRRFTRSRFEEPAQGGGQLPYFFEEGLVAFLRDSDIARVRARGPLSATTMANPFAVEILERLDNEPGTAWLALSWRQFLHWFVTAERRLASGELEPRRLLRDAEAVWLRFEDEDVLMEEPRNDGSWLRPWRRAIAEFAT